MLVDTRRPACRRPSRSPPFFQVLLLAAAPPTTVLVLVAVVLLPGLRFRLHAGQVEHVVLACLCASASLPWLPRLLLFRSGLGGLGGGVFPERQVFRPLGDGITLCHAEGDDGPHTADVADVVPLVEPCLRVGEKRPSP